jgi:ABC-type transporter MlaC component
MNFKRSLVQHIAATVLLWLMASLVIANKLDAKATLFQQYQPIVNAVSKQLTVNHQIYKKDPNAFQQFLDKYIRLHWNARSTAKALLGAENFKSLNKHSRQLFEVAVETTLLRYAFEGISLYSSQQFQLVDVAISDSGNMGWVQIVMSSKIIPDLNLDVLVKRNLQGIWKAVDVRFKGITYVSVKKHEFQKILNKQGIDFLIASLNEKNNTFFGELCAAAENMDNQTC